MQNTERPPYDVFDSELRSCNHLEAWYKNYVNLLKSVLTTEQSGVKFKMSKPTPTGVESYQYLQQLRKQQQMKSFKDFLLWYNKKDDVWCSHFGGNAINDGFLAQKDIDMMKLGCTLPILANKCLNKSTDNKFYPIMEADKDPFEKIWEDVVCGPSNVSKRQAVVDETFIWKSTDICK